MSEHNRTPMEQPKRNIAPLAAGLAALLLLVIIGGYYLLNFGKQSTPASISGTEAEESSLDIPKGVPESGPEDEAPGTPTPGFMDDFEDGLDPVWVVHYGDPLTMEGQLTSNIGAGIAAGDASWENYQIEFDVDTSRVGCSFVDTSNSVGVRLTDFDHAYWFVFTNCSTAWSPFAGGVPELFPNTTVGTSKAVRHITIKVEEAKMSALEDGTLLSSITGENYRTGGIFLQIEARTFYDNFQVTLLP